jgi:hypothetical protein
MPSEILNARNKRKTTTEVPEEVVSSTDDQSNSKARRVSTDASASTNANALLTAVVTTSTATANDTFASNSERSESIESIAALIQDLLHSDNAKVKAALLALDLDLEKEKKKCDICVTAGGCLALVGVVKDCLKKATEKIPACNEVTNVNEHSEELITICMALRTIFILTHNLEESRVRISSIGGVEVVVKAMKTFPKCHDLQGAACLVLGNLSSYNLGEKKTVESGGLHVLLAAVNNHLDSAKVCHYAFMTMSDIIKKEDKENIRLLMSLGGATAVVKVREEHRESDAVQIWVRTIGKLIGTEMNSWADEE